MYRGQTSTMGQILALSRIRITNTQEAVAFLRAVQPLYTQVAEVLQRASIAVNRQVNREREALEKPVEKPVETAPEPVKDETFQPEELKEGEDFSLADKKAKIAKLKKANSKKED